MGSTNGNGTSKMWGQIQEVNASQVKARSRGGQWHELYCELVLRLERTLDSRALAVPFDDEKAAQTAMRTVRGYFDRHHGKGCASLFFRTVDGRPMVFVMRGPAYGKAPLSELEALRHGD